MENNGNRAPSDVRAPGGVTAPVNTTTPLPVQPLPVQPRPPLTRVDSRSAFPVPGPRPLAPSVIPQQQQRPQFQPGGAVNNPPQYLPRPGTPAPRAPITGQIPQQQGSVPRSLTPLQRPPGQQPILQQQPLRPAQVPVGQGPPRAAAPSNLQFGPRQQPQIGNPTTPDGTKPIITQLQNGSRNAVPPGPVLKPLLENQKPNAPVNQFVKQASQGSLRSLDTSGSIQATKAVTLDNQSTNNDNNYNVNKPDINTDMPGIPKNRSYSISAAPGMPSPIKLDDDRRKSVSAIGGKNDELNFRSSGLGPIQEVKADLKETLRNSKENIKTEISIEGRDRPDSRLSSKMSESFIGTLPSITTVKKPDDDDDVILQNSKITAKSVDNNKTDISERSPSLSRSEDSPEPKQISTPINLNKTSPKQSFVPEAQRTKTPIEMKRNDQSKDVKATSSPISVPSKLLSSENKTPNNIIKKPTELFTATELSNSKKSTPRKVATAPKSKTKDGDNDSGVDESTQGNDVNGSPGSPNKKLPSKLPTKDKSNNGPVMHSLSRSSSKSAAAKTPENPLPVEKKKVPMNKIQVGNAPSPNIKAVKSKIGSLDNTTYKPGGGNVKIENKKLDYQKATPRIAAKNDAYVPSGGTKKIASTKLEWNAKSKIGSLQNTAYKPGGGDKKIETVKLDFKEKAKPKVASTVNITHKPGGGAVKIENQKLEFKAQSKVGSMDNVKHKPGGGEVKIFDDKEYIKNISGASPALSHSGQEEYYMSMHEWADEEFERPSSRCRSARAPVTPRTPRALSPRRIEDERRMMRNNDRNRRASTARPATARNSSRSACARSTSSIHNRPAFTVY